MEAGQIQLHGNVMGVSFGEYRHRLAFIIRMGGIVGGSDVDVGGGDGIFLSVGWHTKLAVAQRIGERERGRKKVKKRERERENPSLMLGSLLS